MEAIPEVYGVEDSDELQEALQEDAQAWNWGGSLVSELEFTCRLAEL